MGAALNGNLQDFGIAEVFQLVGQQRKTGVLEVTHEARTLRVAFDAGSVVWGAWGRGSEHQALAEMLVRCGLVTRERVQRLLEGSRASARALRVAAVESGDVAAGEMDSVADLLTHEVIFEVLRWKKGSFHFSARPVDHDRPVEKLLGAESILMDGLRMVDEWETFADLVPSDEAVFRRSASFEVYRQRARAEARGRVSQAEAVYQLVDGRLAARRVIDLSRLGSFDGTRALAALHEARVVEVVDDGLAPRAQRERRGARAWVQAASTAVVALLPLIVLAALVLQVGAEHRVWVPSGVPGVPIARSAYPGAVASFEARRLRHAMEAYRYLWRRWPESLAELERTGYPSGLERVMAMAGPEAGSYYYATRGDDVLLLPPQVPSLLR